MADYKDIIAGTISNIVGKVKEAAESPSVQQAVGKVKGAAEETVNKVKEAARGQHRKGGLRAGEPPESNPTAV